MKSINLEVLVIAIFLLMDVVLATNYCKAGLCDPDKKHIGCGNIGLFNISCPYEHALVPMTEALKSYVLKKHNQARSNIANGNITGYDTANQMIEMTWDNELAKLAEYNAKRCTFSHDECRNTDNYKYAGQNIAMVSSSPDYKQTIPAIDYLFAEWFNEYKDCDMTYIRKYRKSDSGDQIGHFTQIVSAGANKVGCAITTFKDSSKNVYLVCDYSLTNILKEPIYTTGKPCSACKKGCSLTYPGLCNSKEVYPQK